MRFQESTDIFTPLVRIENIFQIKLQFLIIWIKLEQPLPIRSQSHQNSQTFDFLIEDKKFLKESDEIESIRQQMQLCLAEKCALPALVTQASLANSTKQVNQGLNFFILHSNANCIAILFRIFQDFKTDQQKLNIFFKPISTTGFQKLYIINDFQKGLSRFPGSQITQFEITNNKLPLIFALIRQYGKKILHHNASPERCILALLNHLFEIKEGQYEISVSILDRFFQQIQDIHQEMEKNQQFQSPMVSDQTIYQIILDYLLSSSILFGQERHGSFNLKSGNGNQFVFTFKELSRNYQISCFTQLRQKVIELFSPCMILRDFFDEVLDDNEVCLFEISVTYSDECVSSVSTSSFNRILESQTKIWDLDLKINIFNPRLQSLKPQLEKLFYYDIHLLSLTESLLSKSWGIHVELHKFDSERLIKLWNSKLHHRWDTPVQQMRSKIQGLIDKIPKYNQFEKMNKICYTSTDKPYFEYKQGRICFSKHESGQFIERKPPKNLQQLNLQDGVNHPILEIQITCESIKKLKYKLSSSLDHSQNRNYVFSFDPDSQMLLPCIQSHPQGLALQLQALSVEQMDKINKLRNLNKSQPILLWKTLFQICMKISKDSPLEFFQRIITRGIIYTAIEQIQRNFDGSQLFSDFEGIICDFKLKNQTHQLEMAILEIQYSCFKNFLVVTLIIGKKQATVSIRKLASLESMAIQLLSFEHLIEFFTNIKQHFESLTWNYQKKFPEVENFNYRGLYQGIKRQFKSGVDSLDSFVQHLQSDFSLKELFSFFYYDVKDFHQQMSDLVISIIQSYYDKPSDSYHSSIIEQYRVSQQSFNKLIFAISQDDAKKFLNQAKGKSRPVICIQQEFNNFEIYQNTSSLNQSGQVNVGTRNFSQYDLILWTTAFTNVREFHAALGPLFVLCKKTLRFYKIPEDQQLQHRVISLLANSFTNTFAFQFYNSEKQLPISLKNSIIPYTIIPQGIKIIFDKVKRPLSFNSRGDLGLKAALWNFRKLMNSIKETWHKEIKILDSLLNQNSLSQKLEAFDLQSQHFQVNLTKQEYPLVIANLVVALQQFCNFLQEQFLQTKYPSLFPDFSLTPIQPQKLEVLKRLYIFTEIFSSFSFSFREKSPVKTCFLLKIQKKIPIDRFNCLQEIYSEYYTSLCTHLKQKLRHSLLTNSVSSRWSLKSTKLASLFILPSFDEPIQRLKNLTPAFNIQLDYQNEDIKDQAELLLTLPTALHRIANVLLQIRPLFQIRKIDFPSVFLKFFMGDLEQIILDEQQQNLTLKLCILQQTEFTNLLKKLLEKIQMKQTKPYQLYAMPEQKGIILPQQIKSLSFQIYNNYVALQSIQLLKLKIFLCSFATNQSYSLSFKTKTNDIVVELTQVPSQSAFWLVIIAYNSQIIQRKLYIRINAQIARESPLFSKFMRRDSCFEIKTDVSNHFGPLLRNKNLRTVNLENASRSQKQKYSKSMKVNQASIIVNLEDLDYQQENESQLVLLDQNFRNIKNIYRIFLKDEFAKQYQQLQNVQKKQIGFLKERLEGIPVENALELQFIALDLLPQTKLLQKFPVSKAGRQRSEVLAGINSEITSAYFLHLTLPSVVINATFMQENNHLTLYWIPPIRGLYQLYLNGTRAFIDNFMFAVVSSFDYQAPQLYYTDHNIQDYKVELKLKLRVRDEGNCIVTKTDYSLLGLQQPTLNNNKVKLSPSSQLQISISNASTNQSYQNIKFDFLNSDEMIFKCTFPTRENEIDIQVDIIWNQIALIESKHIIIQGVSFQTRLQRFKQQLPKFTDDQYLTVSRENLMKNIGQMQLIAGQIYITFVKEQGIDCGGVRKEFFQLLGQQFTQSKTPQFFTQRQPLCFFPVHLKENKFLQYLKNFGTLIALAIVFGDSLEFRLTPAFHAALTGIPFKISLLAEQNKQYNESLQKLRQLDEQTLAYSELFFQYDDSRVLLKDGDQIQVTKENLEKFIFLKSKFYCFDSAKEEISAIKKGINLIFKCDLFKLFSWKQLNKILAGTEEIDKFYLKDKIRFNQYYVTYQIKSNFLKWVDQATQENLHLLLLFATSSANIPLTQRNEFYLTVSYDKRSDTQLPTASTCSKELVLYNYKSYQILKEKLEITLKFGAKGFANA